MKPHIISESVGVKKRDFKISNRIGFLMIRNLSESFTLFFGFDGTNYLPVASNSTVIINPSTEFETDGKLYVYSSGISDFVTFILW